MISIIVSSYQPKYYNQLEENIKNTCGVDYQIIKIDNVGKMGVAEAYNKGGLIAKYPYLLFIHEDILFHTVDWGTKLINHLNQEKVGIVGVAGSSYICNVPGSWYLTDCDFNHVNFIQNSKIANNPIKRKVNINENRTHVFKLDGMFLGIRKDVYNMYKFNEEINGFHGYDTDISLRTANKLYNYVIDDIIIEHFSSGVLSRHWIKAHEYIRNNLHHPKSSSYDEKLEMQMFIFYSDNYFNNFGFSTSSIIKSLKYFPSKLSISSILIILKFYLKNTVKKLRNK